MNFTACQQIANCLVPGISFESTEGHLWVNTSCRRDADDVYHL
jgi:hypothetical protein